ncbi:MAG TPA: hypothetical protein VG937_13260 [Polyangiaceae bacterium]|nr:hypothetical protein [Polyangiaceae bacterium]
MKRLIGGMIAFVALAVGCGAEDSASMPSNQEGPRAVEPELSAGPEGLPEGYVETPVGGFHQSCVHEVPDGAVVDRDGAIRLDGQVLRAPSACAFKRVRINREQVIRGTSGVEGVARQSSALGLDGWVSRVQASANNLGVFPPRFNGIESTMTVPPTPTVQLFQQIYLFVSLTPADDQAILQPVLQWGGEAGNRWMVAGWFIDRADNVFHSTRVNVTAGETIKGTIRDVRNSCVGTDCQWEIKLLRGNTSISSLRVNSTEAYAHAQKAVFEAYKLTSCRQLPSGVAYFLNTKLYAPYDPANVDARIEVTGSVTWKKTINPFDLSCGFDAVFPNPQTAVLTWTWN